MRTSLSRITDYPAYLEEAWMQHLAEREPNAPTVISTFAGCGGSSLGYSMAGFHELLAVEWNDNAVATFKRNFPDVPVYHGDINKLSVDECLELAGIGVGELDVLDGSPPCQGFSTAGKRQFRDVRNQLSYQFIRLLRGLQPKVFVMENVSGMVKSKMKLIFADILRELKVSGYKVRVRMLNAMYFGVPQSRERLIFIGVRKDLGVEPSHPVAETKPFGPPKDENASSLWLTEKERKQAESHRKRHRAKGHGWGFQVLSSKVPSPTWPKTQILQTSPLWREGLKLRAPSLREIQFIGAYPLEFSFTSYEGAWVCIGNSVPPLMMRSIALHIREHILDKMMGREPVLVGS